MFRVSCVHYMYVAFQCTEKGGEGMGGEGGRQAGATVARGTR